MCCVNTVCLFMAVMWTVSHTGRQQHDGASPFLWGSHTRLTFSYVKRWECCLCLIHRQGVVWARHDSVAIKGSHVLKRAQNGACKLQLVSSKGLDTVHQWKIYCWIISSGILSVRDHVASICTKRLCCYRKTPTVGKPRLKGILDEKPFLI